MGVTSNDVKLTGSNAKEETMQNGATAVGDGTVLDLGGMFSSASFQVSGTFVGSIIFEVSNNGTDWEPLKVYGTNGQAGNATVSAKGLYQTGVAGIKKARARVATYTSGSITVVGVAGVVG